MPYDFSQKQEHHPTFLHPNGIGEDPKPYITEWGIVLPGIVSATFEMDCLIEYINNPIDSEKILPRIKQLGRIALNSETGCWELPIYKDGNDTYSAPHPRAGTPRARYGSLMVKGVMNNPTDHLAHRVMYTIFRGPVKAGTHVDHLCRNPKCCYHRHLEAVTPAENTRRIHEANRLANGQMILE